MLSREEEKQNVIKWLEHPHELGCEPSKIEFTNEFTDEDGVCAYTRGMRQFGKDEMEILGSKQLPSELRDFLINIAGYVLEGDVLLHDGETIGVSNEQRCKITKSPGVFMEGESLKIEW